MAVCEEHRNQEKLCSCFEQKELVTCVDCEADLKEKASKWHFFIPGIIFMLVNLAIFLPAILDRLNKVQTDRFDLQIAKDLAFEIKAAASTESSRRRLASEEDFSEYINL